MTMAWVSHCCLVVKTPGSAASSGETLASSMTGLAFLAATILACTSGDSAMFMNLCARSALLLAVGIVGVEGLEVGLQGLEFDLALIPAACVAAREQGRNVDDMAGVEIGRGQLAFQRRVPEIVPAVEGDTGGNQVGAIADGVHVRPAADVVRADLGAIDQVRIIGDFAQVQLLVQTGIDVKPADVRCGERDVAFRLGSELGLVQAVDGAARDVLHRHPCLPRELLGDGLIDKVPEAAAPGAYHQGILRMRLS
ncbi:hypothetical protein G6F65_018243 [Rhizopus arrhizus]|nr:hypothetical protein G6F65_018243 [Rhizopus arrhizus]